jgi:dolichyl-phosphate-mannose-protein mannosyltransferase
MSRNTLSDTRMVALAVLVSTSPSGTPIGDTDVSFLGQQVTGYPHNDTNNVWQVVPTKSLPATGRGRIVRHNDVIQLLHVQSNTVLLTHDVASPLMPTNQEFTTIDKDDTARYNETLFQLALHEGAEGEAWKSKAGHFRLVHQNTKVALWTHAEMLPDWAFNQQEVNGNKNSHEKTAIWFVDDIIAGEGNQPVAFKRRA